jgi:hypothetical protein
MKSLKEIADEFTTNIPLGSVVSMTLKTGLEVQYDNKSKIAFIKAAEKPFFGMPQQGLAGKFSGYSWDSSDDSRLEFKGDEKGYYYFSLRCSQIDNYKVLKNASEKNCRS